MGFLAEARVADVLAREGWTVLERNWRGGGGEVDLVAERRGCLRFVEVKVRDGRDPLADEAVSPAQQRRLRSAGEAWLAERGEPPVECAFLVVVVDHDGSLDWLDDAFDG